MFSSFVCFCVLNGAYMTLTRSPFWLSTWRVKQYNIKMPRELCLSSLLGNFVSTKYNLSGGYMPSFQKKEVGSVGQRIQLAPMAGQHTGKVFFHLCKAKKIISDIFRSDNLLTWPVIWLKKLHSLSNFNLE